jgi:GNAT superfamily N-acetyltransferase
MAADIEVRRLAGDALGPWLDAVARLRIAVFRDWPYLYAGDLDYERGYLQAYARSPDSVFVLAFDGDAVVGASTGLPLADDTDQFQRPFRDAGRAVDDVFYFGESVLLPVYRGRGLGHRFFDEREAHAAALGRFAWTGFCAVDRHPADPRRPAGHRGNEAFWAKRGYLRQPGLTVHLAWQEIGEPAPTDKPLTFWLRPLKK